MLSVEVPGSNDEFRAAVSLPIQACIPSVRNNDPLYFYHGDPVISMLNERTLPSMFRSYASLFGYKEDVGYRQYETVVTGREPHDTGYSGGLDKAFFSSWFGDWKDVFVGRNLFNDKHFKREGNVYHPSYYGRGYAADPVSSISPMNTSIVVFGKNVPHSTYNRCTRIARDLTGAPSYQRPANIKQFCSLDELPPFSFFWSAYSVNLYAQSRNFLIEMDEPALVVWANNRLSASYTLRVRQNYNAGSIWKKFTVHRNISVEVYDNVVSLSTVPISGTFDLLGTTTKVRIDSTIVDTDRNSGFGAPSGSQWRPQGVSFSDGGEFNNRLCLMNPIQDTSGLRKRFPDTPIYRIDGRMADLERDYAKAIPEILGTTFFSTADAIEPFVEVLKTNHLETLAEAGSMLSLLPDIGLVVNILRDAKNAKFLSAGKKIIDLVTGSHLKWVFGQAPTLDAIREFSDEYDNIVERLEGRSLWGHRVLNGKFSYTIPHDAGPLRMGDVIVTRSKVDLWFEHETLLHIFLGAQGVGLVPSLSSMWDLFPLSFAVDWFYGTGRRLKDIDTRMALLVMPVRYCVHSLTVYRPYNQDEMRDVRLQPVSSDEQIGVKLYDRIVSRRSPPLRQSEFYDYRASAGIPSFTTVGSLFYQILS